MSRRAHCSRSSARLRAAADEEQRAERVAALQRAVAAAAGVGDPAPVDGLVAESASETMKSPAWGERERRADAGQRVGVLVAAQDGRPRPSPRAPPGRRRSSQRPPRRSATSPPGRKRRAGSPPPLDVSRLRRPSQPADQVDPFDLGQALADLVAVGALALRREQVDVGGAAGRADRELRLLGAVVGGRQDRPLAAEQLGQRQAAVDVGLGVVGDQDQRVVLEEAVDARPPASTSSRSSRRPWRSTRPSPRARGGGSSCRCRRARRAGSRRRRPDQLGRAAGRVGVADAGDRGRLAGDLAARVEVAVEELLRAVGVVAELEPGRRRPRGRSRPSSETWWRWRPR